MVHTPKKVPKITFGITKALSWSSLALLLVWGMFMSFIISNLARDAMLDKQKEKAALLAENISLMVFQGFTLPHALYQLPMDFRNKETYNLLDRVIKYATKDLNMREVRIYSSQQDLIRYSTNPELVEKTDIGGLALAQGHKGEPSVHIIHHKVSPFWTLFKWDLEPGSVSLETIWPMSTTKFFGGEETVRFGVLQLSQDITDDYKTVIRFQWLIIATTLVSSLVLFLIMFVLIRRVDRSNAMRQVEKELHEHELHQNEKLVSMGRMVASIAHEIRNPLGIIRSSAELLLKRGNEDSLSSRITQAIFDESKRLSQTVTDFLDYARPKQPKQDKVDVVKVLEQVFVFLEGEFIKRNVRLKKSIAPNLFVSGDKDLLYRAFYNIVTNGMQAMSPTCDDSDSSVDCNETLDEEALANMKALTIKAEAAKNKVYITFTDTGPGFDNETKYKLLDPFFTTKDNGTGLGLAIVNNIVKSHQGSMDLDNGPEKGAIFTLEFPQIKE